MNRSLGAKPHDMLRDDPKNEGRVSKNVVPFRAGKETIPGESEMKKMLTAALIGVVLMVSAGPASAVNLVSGNNYFPYSDERLPSGGLATVLVQAVFKHMGEVTDIAFLPWDEGYEATQSNRYLATFPYVRNPEREQAFLFSDPLFSVRPHIFMSFNNAPGLTQPEDLAGHTLCVPKGWAVDGYLQKVVELGQVAVYDQTGIVGCFQLLHQGKVDAISIDRELGTIAARAISAEPWTKIRNLAAGSNPNHLIVSKSLPNAADWINRFNTALQELRLDGTITRLTEEYYESYQ